MLENIVDRLPVATILFLMALVSFWLSQRPLLSKKEEKELKELDDILAKLYGGKK